MARYWTTDATDTTGRSGPYHRTPMTADMRTMKPGEWRQAGTALVICHDTATDKHACYVALLRESARVGWPTAFRADLTEHDRAFIERNEGDGSFIWMLRDSGTYITTAESMAAHGRGFAREPDDSAEHRWYIVTGGSEGCRMRPTTARAALQWADSEVARKRRNAARQEQRERDAWNNRDPNDGRDTGEGCERSDLYA